MIINCYCGIADRGKASSLISRISYTSQAGFESALNLSSGFVECAVVITTTSQRQIQVPIWSLW